MSLLRTRRKKIFVSVAVLHAILIAAMSILDAAGVKTFSGVVNLIFLSTYAVFLPTASSPTCFLSSSRREAFVLLKGKDLLFWFTSLH